MAKNIEVGQLVVADGLVGVYRVVGISSNDETADIEKFDIATKKSVGDPTRPVAVDKLTAYQETSGQAAARILREAVTED